MQFVVTEGSFRQNVAELKASGVDPVISLQLGWAVGMLDKHLGVSMMQEARAVGRDQEGIEAALRKARRIWTEAGRELAELELPADVRRLLDVLCS